jgi:hypothetical protein
MNADLQVSASSCEKIIWAWYAYFSGSPILPRPDETPEELKDRVKDAIEGAVLVLTQCNFFHGQWAQISNQIGFLYKNCFTFLIFKRMQGCRSGSALFLKGGSGSALD